MNADQLIDYVLGQLDGNDREQIEHAVKTDPDVALKVERLGRSIHLLLDDGKTVEPPSGLARGTLAMVAQSRLKPRSILDYVPTRVPFKWADFAVAASIFIAGVLTLLPAIQGSEVAHAAGRLCLQPSATGPQPGTVRVAEPVLSVPGEPPARCPRGDLCRRSARCRRT